MSQLKARCIDQVLTFENTPVITSGDVNYDSIMFDFCSRWDGFTKTAVFYRSEDEVYYQLLDEANTCNIPNEVLTEKGDIFIGVFGTSGDTTLTSQVLKYKIAKGAITENLKPSDPTPDIYAQIISRYDAIIEELERQFKKLEDLQAEYTGAVGNADTLNGHKDTYFATAESVTNLENGTTKVGDANKLDGHDIDYFVSRAEVISTSILETVKKLPPYSVKFYKINGSLYTGGDLPSGDYYKYSNALAFKYDEDTATILLFGFGISTRRIAVNHLSGNEWRGWQKYATDAELANYLPLIGGILGNGTDHYPLVIKGNNSKRALIGFRDADNATLGYLGIFGADNPVFIKSDSSGTGTSYALLHTGNMASHVLPLTGGTLTDVLRFAKVSNGNAYLQKNHTADTDNGFYVADTSKDGKLARLEVSAKNQKASFTGDDRVAKELYHSGNSARVHIGTTAPSDTSALWIDTTA